MLSLLFLTYKKIKDKKTLLLRISIVLCNARFCLVNVTSVFMRVFLRFKYEGHFLDFKYGVKNLKEMYARLAFEDEEEGGVTSCGEDLCVGGPFFNGEEYKLHSNVKRDCFATVSKGGDADT